MTEPIAKIEFSFWGVRWILRRTVDPATMALTGGITAPCLELIAPDGKRNSFWIRGTGLRVLGEPLGRAKQRERLQETHILGYALSLGSYPGDSGFFFAVFFISRCMLSKQRISFLHSFTDPEFLGRAIA